MNTQPPMPRDFEKDSSMVEKLPRDVLLRMVNGYQVSQAIHVVAMLGVADTLKDGERHVDDIADQTDTDPQALYRLLRALSAVGVFLEGDQRTFSLTPLGKGLVGDTPGSLRDYAVFVGHGSNWNTWGDLLQGIKTGENVFRQVHGMNVWDYRAQRPEVSAMFNRATAATKLTGSVLDIYDFSPFRLIVDVGGGNGAMLADILVNNPLVKGILFDQPHVVSQGQLETASVAGRCEVIGGDFFRAVPHGGDLYVLRAVLHDWGDVACIEILKTCRSTMADPARLLIVERLVEPPNDGAQIKFFDLTMFVLPGGRERTREEYSGLLDAAGFRIVRVSEPGTDNFTAIEAICG
jgi:hypothetical protein